MKKVREKKQNRKVEEEFEKQKMGTSIEKEAKDDERMEAKDDERMNDRPVRLRIKTKCLATNFRFFKL